MKRYSMEVGIGFNEGSVSAIEDKDGDWVKAEDIIEKEGGPVHPTYGTFKQLLATIESDIRQGYDLRIGLHGALVWFSNEFESLRLAAGKEL